MYIMGCDMTYCTRQRPNPEEAVRFLGLAAAQNYANAQNTLGYMYKKGWQNPDGTRQRPNPEEAVRFLGLAAAQNFVLAQFNLGKMYKKGWQNPDGTWQWPNPEEAVRFYGLAAAQGFAVAQYELGYMYQEGWENPDGTEQPPNPQEAVRLYVLAAAQNFANAQNTLGLMYHDGWEGQRPHFALAMDYFCRAIRQQYLPAQDALKSIVTFTRPPADTREAPLPLSEDLREDVRRLIGDIGYIEVMRHPGMPFLEDVVPSMALHDATRSISLALVCIELFLDNPFKSGLMVTCFKPTDIGHWPEATLGKVRLQDTSYFCVGEPLYQKAQYLIKNLALLSDPEVFTHARVACADEITSPLITQEDRDLFREQGETFRNAQQTCNDYALAVTQFIEANTPYRNKLFMDGVFGVEAP
jgi:TPR repeat protein